MRIVKAIQTCYACPSAWDAWTDEGQYLYLRYRYSHGTATIYDNEISNESKGRIADFVVGEPLDGCITLEEFCIRAGLELDLE